MVNKPFLPSEKNLISEVEVKTNNKLQLGNSVNKIFEEK